MECYLDVMLQVQIELGRMRKGGYDVKSEWPIGLNIDSALWNQSG